MTTQGGTGEAGVSWGSGQPRMWTADCSIRAASDAGERDTEIVLAFPCCDRILAENSLQAATFIFARSFRGFRRGPRCSFALGS